MAKNKQPVDPVIEEVLGLFKSSKEFRRPLEAKWLSYYKAYRAHLDRKDEGINRSNLFIPYSFQTVETIMPRMVASKPRLLVLPREEEDKKNAEVNQALIDYDWSQADMEAEIETIVRAGLIYGTAVVKTTWDADNDIPKAKYVDGLDFYPDPQANGIESMQYAIHRVMRSAKDIKKTYGFEVPDGHEGDPERVSSSRNAISGIETVKAPAKSGKIEVIECWWDDRVVTVVARKFVVRDEKNTYGWIPFEFFRDYIIPNEFYGIGEIEHINLLQQEANSLRNQVMDNNNLIINSMWKRRRSSGVNPRSMVSRPGGIIDVSQMDDIEPLVQTPLPAYVFSLQEVIHTDIQQTTGVSDYQAGVNSQTAAGGVNQTATGISLIQEAGNMRFRLKLRHLEDTLRGIGTKFLAMNQTLLTSPKVIRIVGPMGVDFKQIKDYTDLRGNFDLIPEAGSTQPFDPTADATKFMSFLTALGNVGVLQDIPKKMLLQLIAERFDIKEKDQLTQAFDQQIAQAAQQPQMQPGQPPVSAPQPGQPPLPNQSAPQPQPQQGQAQQPGGSAIEKLMKLPPQVQQQVMQAMSPQERQIVMQVINGH